MLNFQSIDIDIGDETIWVQVSASLDELYYKIGKTSPVHVFSAFVCPGVCTGGYFSGGGYGPMMRMYELMIDNIIEARIMDVNGKILDRKTLGEDVFWAIIGGGGASFGVIHSWKVKLSRVPPKVTVFRVNRSAEQGSFEAFYRWQYVAPNLPKEVFVRAQLDVEELDEIICKDPKSGITNNKDEDVLTKLFGNPNSWRLIGKGRGVVEKHQVRGIHNIPQSNNIPFPKSVGVKKSYNFTEARNACYLLDWSDAIVTEGRWASSDLDL
ncbi:berberine bridge enzyme-like 16 [Humulus lupulus]|uniref:berberine bridge enzyme-like 16 n=1 Tax=Humulus lupulus TaxID=3486 RepID=UPI002B40CF99|nr:berberine bridge enzyme-like 16 [Humulus lupulus]